MMYSQQDFEDVSPFGTWVVEMVGDYFKKYEKDNWFDRHDRNYDIDNGALANIRDYTEGALLSSFQIQRRIQRLEMHLSNISELLVTISNQLGNNNTNPGSQPAQGQHGSNPSSQPAQSSHRSNPSSQPAQSSHGSNSSSFRSKLFSRPATPEPPNATRPRNDEKEDGSEAPIY